MNNETRELMPDLQEIKLPPYVISFDILNILACIAVVALHVNGAFWQFSYDRYWITSNLIETLCYWAVPVFFMLSGANLMDYRERYSTKVFLKKRLVRTLIPFLCWSVIAIIWSLLKSGTAILEGEGILPLKLLDIIINTRAMGIYWFFIPLFAVYLSIPILSAIPKELRKKVFGYIIVLGFVTYSLLPTLCDLIGLPMNYGLQLPVVGGGYLLFAVLGYYVTRYPLCKKARIAIYVVGVLGWACHFFGTWVSSYKAGAVSHTFKGYLNFPCVLFALAVFVWFYYHDWSFISKPRFIGAVRKISGASFGVYLVHAYLIEGITALFDVNIITWQWRILGVPLVYLLSFVIILVIKKVPIVRKIVP